MTPRTPKVPAESGMVTDADVRRIREALRGGGGGEN